MDELKKYGPFRMIWFCSKCKYFAKSFEIHDSCCPKCGEIKDFKSTPGQYELKGTKTGFIFSKTTMEIVGFKPKD